MNPSSHAHSFVSPGFYKCIVVICWKLLRSTDKSTLHKHIQEAISVALCRIRVQ